MTDNQNNMKNERTVESLNDRAWYRAIKVVYALSFLVVSFFVVIVFVDEAKRTLNIPDSKIICQYGNEKQFLVKDVFEKEEMPVAIPSYSKFKDTSVSKKVLEACSIDEVIPPTQTSGRFLDRVTIPGRIGENFVPDPYRTVEKENIRVQEYGGLFVILLIILGIFEVIRRIFYYIVLGKFNPKNGKHE